MTTKNKKIIASVVVLSVMIVSFSPAFTVPANAQWVDVVQATKEMGLDTVAWTLVNLTIERMAASTVNWINTGFKGSPAYVTNPESYFTDIADKVAGQYIFEDPNLNFLCGPISAKIRLALTSNYMREDNARWQCTMTDIAGNMQDFMDDFDRGGWDKFFQLSQRQQNNPIGAFLQAENELTLKIASRQGIEKAKLDWGKGFLSWEECSTVSSGGSIEIPGQPTEYSGSTKTECQINTPGSVIEDKLNEALGSGSQRLQAADEINEIVSALLNQLLNQVVGGIGRGLRGLSSPSSTGQQPVTNQLSNNTSEVGYFGETQDTSALDVPISGSNSATPNDNDCSNYSPDRIMQMATAKIESDPYLTSNDLEQVIRDLDCDPYGIH